MFLHPSIHIEIPSRGIGNCRLGPSDVTRDRRDATSGDVTDSTRELAQRLSGTVEVLLLWHPEVDRVELSLRDMATDVSFHLDVAPGNAIDAFYHPYAYAAKAKLAPLRPSRRSPTARDESAQDASE